MGAHANGSHAGSATAMGDTEGFVQVEVRNVCAKLSRSGKTHQGIEVSAVYIDLSAMLVYQAAQFNHRLLKYPVGRRIGNHDGR